VRFYSPIANVLFVVLLAQLRVHQPRQVFYARKVCLVVVRIGDVKEVDVLLLFIVDEAQRDDQAVFGGEHVDRDGILPFKFQDLRKRHGELDTAEIQHR